MDDPRQPSLEARESGETAENTEQQKLNDATFEPRSYVEQAGDHRQAEAIQNDLTALVENAKPAEETVTAVPPHMPGEADRSKVTAAPGEDEGEKVDAIPITVPDVQTTGGKPSSRPGEEISATPIPLPGNGTQPAGGEISDTPPVPSEKAPGMDNHLPGTKKPGVMGGEPPGNEVSATPIPLPGNGSQPANEFISATPIPLPGGGTQPAGETAFHGTLGPRPDKAMAEREESVAGREPKIIKGIIEKASGDEGDDGGEDITPINLPNIRETARQAEESVRQPKDSAGMKGEDAEIPAVLRRSSEQTGIKAEAGNMETVLRQQGN